MSILFEGLMLCFFVGADFIWLLQIWNRINDFSFSEKLRSITFTVAFLLGLGWLVLENHKLCSMICMLGFMISQFTVAVTFYEYYKDLEIPHE